MSTTVRKNGKSYDSGDVRFSYFGAEEVEVKTIEYNNEQEHQLNHSASNRATSWGKGKITPTANIELYMSAVRRLEKVAKDQTGRADLLLLKPFQIDITYFNEDQEEVNDSIYVKFKTHGRNVNGEMGLAQSFELFALEVEFDT